MPFPKPPSKQSPCDTWQPALLGFAIALLPAATSAQTNLPDTPVPEVRPIDPTQPLTPTPPTPPADNILKQPEAPPTPPADHTENQFFVQTIEVLGATVLTDEISQLVSPLENQNLTLTQLFDLRTQIAQLYITNGYITSGAFLPNNQDLSDGVVQIQVVEGQLEDIQITGLKRLRKAYIRDRIHLATQTPLNRNRLEKALQLLQINPLIKRINAELTAGSSPGQSILLIDVEQSQSFHIGASFDNYRSPSIGSLQGSLDLAHDNVLGFGDRFTGAYSVTDGLDLFDFSYTFPTNPRDGTFSIRYSTVDSEIVTPEFQDFGIRSDFETVSFNLRQPILKTPSSELALGVAFDLRQNQSFLGDQPFAFSLGPNNQGIARTRVLRLYQEWLQRQPTNVLSLRSQFNIGLDLFDATVNDIGPSASFFSWLGQAQFVQQLPFRGLLISRLSAQLTPDALLSLESIGLGGIDTVRGYARNQLLTDNGVLGSIEGRFPLTDNPNTLQLSSFLDVGTGWNNFTLDPNPSTLVGLGFGLRWQPVRNLSLRLDYGIPLVDVESNGNSLQEEGFYFSVRYQPL